MSSTATLRLTTAFAWAAAGAAALVGENPVHAYQSATVLCARLSK